MLKRQVFTLIVLLAITLNAGNALAGGLYITEFGQPSMGASGAGWSVLAEDASTGVANTAGVFWLENDSEWMVTGIYVAPSMKFRAEAGTTVSGNDGGDAGVPIVGGSVFHARKLSDKWALGFGMNSISGASIDYDSGFVGRYWGDEVELLTVTATANLAYRVNEDLAVFFGLPMMFGRLNMDVAVPPLSGPADPSRDGRALIEDGNDFSATVSAGLYWEVNPDTRIGMVYLGENELDFEGDLSIELPGLGGGTTIGDIEADVNFPFAQAVSVALARDLGDRTTLLATVQWEDWSTMDDVLITTNRGGVPISYDWDDTWKFALGVRRRGNGPWTYYTGVAYDTDPTDASKRTADMPIDRQVRLSFGASYELDSGRTINGSLTYGDFGDARVENSNAGGTVIGEYSTNRFIFAGFSVTWH